MVTLMVFDEYPVITDGRQIRGREISSLPRIVYICAGIEIITSLGSSISSVPSIRRSKVPSARASIMSKRRSEKTFANESRCKAVWHRFLGTCLLLHLY